MLEGVNVNFLPLATHCGAQAGARRTRRELLCNNQKQGWIRWDFSFDSNSK
jgi:hypothetical protein